MADIIRYNLDDDTQELLEQVFNWAQELVDLQKDDATHEEMMSIILECADRFAIQRNTIYIEESEEDDGRTVNLKIQVVEDDGPKKPKLTVVADNEPRDKKVLALKDWRKDDDDKIH